MRIVRQLWSAANLGVFAVKMIFWAVFALTAPDLAVAVSIESPTFRSLFHQEQTAKVYR